MTTEDIEKAIEQLPARDLARLREWFEAFDAKRFDAAIERDVQVGKLDGFAEDAQAEYRDHLSQVGKRRYDAIREELERDHFGAYVMINTDTSDYMIAPTISQVHGAFIKRFGEDAPIWWTRIGVSLFASR